MARTGKKVIVFQISAIDLLEETIEYAERRAEVAGLRLTVDYAHDIGLKLIVAGPKDKINLFEHQLRDFMRTGADEEEPF